MKKIFAFFAAAIIAFSGSVNANELSEWAKADFDAANIRGLIPLSLAVNRLNGNITRGEFCNLAMNMYDTIQKEPVKMYECPFEDCYDESVLRAYSLGIVKGKSDTEFCPNDLITRQEIAKLLVNTIEIAGKDIHITTDEFDEIQGFDDFSRVASWAVTDIAKAIKYSFLSGVSEKEIAPLENATREQAIAIISRSEEMFAENEASYVRPQITNLTDGETVLCDELAVEWDTDAPAEEYIVIVKDEDADLMDVCATVTESSAVNTEYFNKGRKYTVTVAAISDNTAIFSEPVTIRYGEEEKKPEEPLFALTSLEDKYKRVFPEGVPFESEEAAGCNMTTITIPVWKLKSDGGKQSSTFEIAVNSNLADEVLQIFTEIYNDSEKFPIKNVGGYYWRNTAIGGVSEHSYGTCIDINYDENYYCYAATGEAITGSFWLPGENPYSITEDGSVVKAFTRRGWAWGGNAWVNLRDYMHFSYLGK